MGKAVREQLSRALNEHLNTIHETLQVFSRNSRIPNILSFLYKKLFWVLVLVVGS